MPATLAELLADALDGLGDYLQTTAGLTVADKVTVRTALVEDITGDTIILGDPTTTQTQQGLRTREAAVTCPGWVTVTRPGAGEAAARTARRAAAALMARVEAALAADRSTAGTITNPGRVVVTTSGLEQSSAPVDGVAGRRATIQFTLSWVHHIT